MDTPWRTAFPVTLPTVSVKDLDVADIADFVTPEVVCEELQWWQLVPRAGEQNAMGWYDRESGQLTMVRETTGPATDLGDGSVRIALDEWTRDPGSVSVARERIVIIAELTPDGARWREMTVDGHTCRQGDPEFEANWAGGTGTRIIDNGRYASTGDRRFRTTGAEGLGRGVARLTVGHRSFSCLRSFDLPVTGRPEEIAQALIDLDTGRTLAYWQYRPTAWDADADRWLIDHPGSDVVVDDRTYQRRNCSGRDEVMLTAAALDLAVGSDRGRPSVV